MSNQAYSGSLRLLSGGKTAGQQLPTYQLSPDSAVSIGREPSCQIVLDSNIYEGVSRRHAEVRPLATTATGSPSWEICDLNSANGTFINGKRLQGCQRLKPGDRILLGRDSAEFIFEYQAPTVASPVGAGVSGNNPDAVSFSQLFPIASTGRDLSKKAFLIPGILTVTFVVLMFATLGTPKLFNLVLASYLAGAAYYFVYQLCGKTKPWWMLVGSAIATVIILLSPLLSLFIFVFRGILPGGIDVGRNTPFPTIFIGMFFGAGLMEELLKALPVFAAYFIGMRLRSPWRERIGVWEPLDGILLGTASAVGFTLLETLGQYVPEIVNNVRLQADAGTGELLGLQLLIPRILGSVAGHMAYSGYFGYFIGLSALIPSRRWQILGIGYFSSAILHALWNSTGSLNIFILALVGMFSYAFLAAAILKARALSPTRAQNFATRFSPPPE